MWAAPWFLLLTMKRSQQWKDLRVPSPKPKQLTGLWVGNEDKSAKTAWCTLHQEIYVLPVQMSTYRWSFNLSPLLGCSCFTEYQWLK